LHGLALGADLAHLSHLLVGCIEADPEPIDLAESATILRFAQAVIEVDYDRERAQLLGWIRAQQWATDTGLSELDHSSWSVGFRGSAWWGGAAGEIGEGGDIELDGFGSSPAVLTAQTGHFEPGSIMQVSRGLWRRSDCASPPH
jgi:hypothetical protein